MPQAKSYRDYLDPEVVSRLKNMALRARLVVEGFITGLHQSPYHGFSVEFAEHRQYMPGDSLRNVDWKVYGKTDRFYIKEYEEETNLKAYLIVDASSSMNFASGPISKFQYATYLAAALSYLMMEQRDAVGLAVFDDKLQTYLPPRSIRSYLNVILSTLDTPVSHRKTQVGKALHQVAERIHRRGLVIVLSDLMDEPSEILSGLKHFRHDEHEVLVFQILDPMELNFSYSRDTIIEDLETGQEITTQPWHIRADYQQLVRDFTETLKRECRKDMVDYNLLDTTTSYDQALFEYLNKRRRLH
jgi:uncharacterized protein (DUF58 family)